MMKADFIMTAMYFGVAFSAPEMIAGKVMIWLFGIWVLGMLLAPFNREMTTGYVFGVIVWMGMAGL